MLREWTQSSAPRENIRTVDCSDIRSRFTTSTGRGGAGALDDIDEKDVTTKTTEERLGLQQHATHVLIHYNHRVVTKQPHVTVISVKVQGRCERVHDSAVLRATRPLLSASVPYKQSNKTTTCDGIGLKHSPVGCKTDSVILLHGSCNWCRMDKRTVGHPEGFWTEKLCFYWLFYWFHVYILILVYSCFKN